MPTVISGIGINLAIILLQTEQFDTAHHWLDRIVERKQDRHCLAFCKRPFALFKKTKENQQKCDRWITLARENFAYLEMP